METEITYTPEVQIAINEAYFYASQNNLEYVVPELLLYTLLYEYEFKDALRASGGNARRLTQNLLGYIAQLEKVPANITFEPTASLQTRMALEAAAEAMQNAGRDRLAVPHVVKGLLSLKESFASYALMAEIGGDEVRYISELVRIYEFDSPHTNSGNRFPDSLLDDDLDAEDEQKWHTLVTCVSDNLDNRNPLVGREKELERTIQVLCRKDKNNPLHVGEPGVGKTALVYGLARLIRDGKVPERLREAKIYQIDMGSLVAGTQFRGDFEKRIKKIMDGASKEGNAIIYIDEIHNMIGAGSAGESSMDASNMLKPYLEAGDIRFIGSTTYDEYKRYFAKSKGIVRRFQQIDIAEPSVEETVEILRQLKKRYENFHGVSYADKALEYAVAASARHISDRFLPDKAIDLIDEAGAYRELHPLPQKRQTVDKALIADILSKICKVDALAMRADDNKALQTLEQRISARIFGQDEAVRLVSEAVLLAKAGLTDEGKPLASLLFVGPTGVGKTEVAKVLAQELGIELLRFDMSEYAEKHTVAKLIGSPAGYVGYEDGGLLTDAIRKTPNCVLLLDEIEKAHPDIYNILLQVMDYACLTDNKGGKADFRNVVLIMTSNAGAQYASQSNIGFASSSTAGAAMLRQVKKTFKPEFINRLSNTVVFNEMNRLMAGQILDKKLRRLRRQLEEKHVSMNLTEEAREYILNEGFTREYGARELDRIISSKLKPLLMRAILFGKLKKGGTAEVSLADGELAIT